MTSLAPQLSFFERPATAAPRPTVRLRPYQEDARRAVLDALREHRSALVVLPTGCGKTVLFASIAASWPGRVLALAHRRELIEQMRAAMERASGEPAAVEMADFWAGGERLVCASVQTLVSDRRRERFRRNPPALIIVDECFPAGTPIAIPDGVCRIENIAVGDVVIAWDERTDGFEPRRVTRLFSSRPAGMVRVRHSGGRQLICTSNHPVFVAGKGWVPAGSLKPDDLLLMRDHARDIYSVCRVPGPIDSDRQDEDRHMAPVGSDVLLDSVPGCVGAQGQVRADGAYEPCPRVGADEGAQPNGAAGVAGEDARHAAGHRPRAKGAPGQRDGAHGAAAATRGSAWMGDGGCDPDEETARHGVPHLLQGRHREPGVDGGRGDRRVFAHVSREAGPGSQERGTSLLTRVEGVEVLEPGSDGTFGGLCPGGVVYNFEVEGLHTYIAGGVVVHNCHHGTAAGYVRILNDFPEARVLGVTATPDRTDEEALGQVFDTVAHRLDIDDAIDGGWLVPVETRIPEGIAIDLQRVQTRAGDLAEDQLDAQIARHLREIACATLAACGDRKTILFAPKVATAHDLAAHLNREAGRVVAAAVDGGMDDDARDAIIGRRGSFKRGDLRYLVNVGIATEGYDDPEVSAVVIARPTKSRALFTQMVGRGLRPLPGVVDGPTEAAARRAAIAASAKPRCLLLNFHYLAGKHTLIGPEDILGGKYTIEERAVARQIAKETGATVDEALKEARVKVDVERAKQAAIAARMKAARVEVRWGSFDPFAAFGLKGVEVRPGMPPASPEQIQWLRDKGIDVPANLTSAHAEKLRRTIYDRQRRGLCSVRQSKVLRSKGVDPTHVKFGQASKLIAAIERNNWQPLSREAVAAILGGGQ